MKINKIIDVITEDIAIEIGDLPYLIVKSIISKHVEEARKELLREAKADKQDKLNS
jgi:hypothetical protein